MTAPAIQTSPRLDSEHGGGVFVFPGAALSSRGEGPGGGCDLPPPAGPLERRIRDIFSATAHGSRSAPVRFGRAARAATSAFPRAHARGAATITNQATKGTA